MSINLTNDELIALFPTAPSDQELTQAGLPVPTDDQVDRYCLGMRANGVEKVFGIWLRAYAARAVLRESAGVSVFWPGANPPPAGDGLLNIGTDGLLLRRYGRRVNLGGDLCPWHIIQYGAKGLNTPPVTTGGGSGDDDEGIVV